jgi:hypothetical protein
MRFEYIAILWWDCGGRDERPKYKIHKTHKRTLMQVSTGKSMNILQVQHIP